MTKEDFMSDVRNMQIDFEEYEKCRPTIVAMLGLTP